MAPLAGFHRWTRAAERDRELAAAVAAFIPVDVPAGHDARRFLTESAADEYPASVTWLLVGDDGRVDGFYTLCNGAVELATRDRTERRLGASIARPTVSAVTLAWLAKRKGAPRTVAGDLFDHALATARVGARTSGAIAMALDPYDADSADIWTGDRYGFRRSRTNSSDGIRRLWRPLFTADELSN